MDIVSCEHPVRVFNKYLGEYVWARCGHCNACKRARAAKWVSRLEHERMNRKHSFFVTLTYDEDNLPLLSMHDNNNGDCFLIDERRNVSIPFSDLVFSSAADRQYFDSRIAHRGIPYASVTDLQKFHKRLNKYFHDNVSQAYKTFRYFAVSEYGSTTLRPHFHSIYFTDSDEVAANFAQGIRACWKFGIIDCQYVQKSANSYVAQYLNELFDLPSFYSVSPLRPFFVCSKHPSIGSDFYNEKEFRDIFENTSVTRPVHQFASQTSVSDVPLQSCVENRLFPKCRAFSEISHTLRVSIYRLSIRWFGAFTDFEQFKWNCIYAIRNGAQKLTAPILDVDRYLSLIADNFSERGMNALRRLYYISKRVVNNCITFGCTIEHYVSKIEQYWSKKELYVLRQFYQFQTSLDNPEELLHCYPEFAYQAKEKGLDILPLVECPSYRLYCADNAFIQEKNTKSHFKNMYFETLQVTNKSLFNILLTYYYAKKCNEVIEAYGQSCP